MNEMRDSDYLWSPERNSYDDELNAFLARVQQRNATCDCATCTTESIESETDRNV